MHCVPCNTNKGHCYEQRPRTQRGLQYLLFPSATWFTHKLGSLQIAHDLFVQALPSQPSQPLTASLVLLKLLFKLLDMYSLFSNNQFRILIIQLLCCFLFVTHASTYSNLANCMRDGIHKRIYSKKCLHQITFPCSSCI